MSFELGEFVSKNVYLSIFVSVVLLGSLVVIYVISRSNNTPLAINNSLIEGSNSVAQNTSSDQDIIVDLSGAVNKPGVYTVSGNARIADLIRKGEGFSNNVSAEWVSKKLNMAMKVKDSEKVYIPFEWDYEPVLSEDANQVSCDEMNYADAVDFLTKESTVSAKVADDSNGLVNVNTASLQDLDTLPGIGAVYAQKIIDNRPYKDSEELISKTKLSSSLVKKIENLLSY